jgi:RNA polymerase sigma factor (sigma-70 family)
VVEKTDNELIDLARQGDKEAFGVLTHRYLLPTRRLAMRLVSREDLAQDLAQEAVMQAYLSLDRLRQPERFKSWLYGIVLNLCRSHIRRREFSMFSLEAVMEGRPQFALPLYDLPLPPERAAEENELQAIILGAVNALTPRDRDAILLFYYARLNLREIAVIQGISFNAVKVRLHRARQRLKEILLAKYPEIIPTELRRKKMIKVTVADVIKQPEEVSSSNYVLLLRDEAGKRALPIWVGAHEGESIAMGLSDFAYIRPLTYNLLVSMLQSIDAVVQQVCIEALKESTFFAVIRLISGKKVSEMDARPSDAINLAVRTDTPIFVSDDVMARAGVDLPAKYNVSAERRGVEDIIREMEEKKRKFQEELKPFPTAPEEIEKAKEKMVAALFGD